MFRNRIKKATRLDLPNGLAYRFKNENDPTTYFLIKNGSLLKFFSERAFQSWKLEFADIDPEAILKLEIKGTLGFRDGTLIFDYSDGKIYLISDNKRRLIAGPDALGSIGLDERKMVYASKSEVELHPLGEPLE